MQRRIDNPRRRGRQLRRRGITAVLAMIFMGLIGTLGFYSTITTSTKLAHNDENGARALAAAESGLQFMRYHLAWVELPPTTMRTGFSSSYTRT